MLLNYHLFLSSCSHVLSVIYTDFRGIVVERRKAEAKKGFVICS